MRMRRSRFRGGRIILLVMLMLALCTTSFAVLAEDPTELSGTKMIECPDCGGSGKEVCSYCNGSGGHWETDFGSPLYDGVGSAGRGQVWDECTSCWGDGEDDCSRCYGRGEVDCYSC